MIHRDYLLLLRPDEVLSGILDAAILEVTDDTLGVLLQRHHVREPKGARLKLVSDIALLISNPDNQQLGKPPPFSTIFGTFSTQQEQSTPPLNAASKYFFAAPITNTGSI